ncbi:APC family permease [Jatrophihabitans telluris]|uniref:APC family permease n=1 Tax=Jatrophihabitans telluris TaxID=2038343 RepID=A0ABY4QU41_9ACTN|nr:APC family permease [Jatrophihabitans telluris]UQX87010.1 APC family permease [Jatrophihabitans telluris]
MSTTLNSAAAPHDRTGRELHRSVGLFGLMFIALGSIIGSGWLLGALGAAQSAGPASLLSWILAAMLLIVLALIHAELGAAYPVAGGTARFPYFAFGTLAGFTAGWAAYLQAVTIAPIEVEASISYLASTGWAKKHLHLLHGNGTLTAVGVLVASAAMLLFTIVNLMGAKLLAASNNVLVIWKLAVPILAIVVIMSLSFHASNFHAGGGFMPYGVHGVFAALPAGVVFSLQGFEQAVQMAGEARNPRRDISRAIISAMFIGAAVYILLEVAFIGGLAPKNLVHGWANPIGAGDFGPYYTLALAAGAGWLATILLIDAVISPCDTGLIYLGTSARLSYALGEEEVLSDKLTQTNRRGVPTYSILLAFVIGEITFLPFPSWSSLVGLVTGATAIMYAFAPVSLAALQARDPDRPRPYRLPMPKVLNPVGFVAANLIIYWGGFEATWKLLTAIFVGRVLFEITLRRAKDVRRADIDWRAASWIWPWLIGITIIGLIGRYGKGAHHALPNWIDLLVVAAFSLVIFYYAVSLAMGSEQIKAAVDSEERQMAELADLNLPA